MGSAGETGERGEQRPGATMAEPTNETHLTAGPRIRIPLDEIEFTFARSSGPGGQNVNKVNSKAVLRWSFERTTALPPDVRERFLEKYRTRLTRDGDVVISSERYRDQPKNVADCLERLRQWLADVATPPKRRRPSKPTRGSRERRLKAKKQAGETKRGRQSRWDG